MLSLSEVFGRVLLVSHADADGHIIAEQSRRNLVRAGHDVDLFIDRELTKGYRLWDKLSSVPVQDEHDTVIFLDLMLNPKDPESSVDYLADLAKRHARKQFFLLDHHPMPTWEGKQRENLEISFSNRVYDCCVGTPSWLMAIAALCDRDEEALSDRPNENQRLVAQGVMRIMADQRRFVGFPMIALLATDRWDLMRHAALEQPNSHKQMYGHRTKTAMASRAMDYAASWTSSIAEKSAALTSQNLIRGESIIEFYRQAAARAEQDDFRDRIKDCGTPLAGSSRELRPEPEDPMEALWFAALMLNPSSNDVISLKQIAAAWEESAEEGERTPSIEALEALADRASFLHKVEGGYRYWVDVC